MEVGVCAVPQNNIRLFYQLTNNGHNASEPLGPGFLPAFFSGVKRSHAILFAANPKAKIQ
jgi:hypothetical protein